MIRTLNRRELAWFWRQLRKRIAREGGFRGFGTVRFEDGRGRRLCARSENVITDLGLWEAYSAMFGNALYCALQKANVNNHQGLTQLQYSPFGDSLGVANYVAAKPYFDGTTTYSGYDPLGTFLATTDATAEAASQNVIPAGTNCAVGQWDAGSVACNQAAQGDMQVLLSFNGVASPPTLDSLCWTSGFQPNGTASGAVTSLYGGGAAGGSASVAGLEMGAKTLLQSPVTPAPNSNFQIEYDFLFD